MIHLIKEVHDLADLIDAVDNEYVNIDEDRYFEMVEFMKKRPPKQRQVDENKIDPSNLKVQEFILKELVADSVNYCYWVYDSDIRPNNSGSTRMRELLNENFQADMAMRSQIDFEYQLRRFYSAMMLNRFPLMDKRLKHLMALARPVVVRDASASMPYEGSPVGFVLVDMVSCGTDFNRAFDFLVTQCDGFGDDPFLKRAILFFMQMNRILGLYEEDIKQFPIPADYQVPKMLNAYGITKYAQFLDQLIYNGAHLLENSPAEMAIRATSIVTCRTLAKDLGWSSADVDGWFFTRRKEFTHTKHHCCITSNY